MSLDQARETNAFASVVARSDRWSTAADVAALVEQRPRRAAESGTELRASVQRLVDCVNHGSASGLTVKIRNRMFPARSRRPGAPQARPEGGGGGEEDVH